MPFRPPQADGIYVDDVLERSWEILLVLATELPKSVRLVFNNW
jgi:hypothetical protein